MVAGAWDLAAGLRDGGRHLTRVERQIERGAMKAARFEALSAAAATRRASAGLASHTPLLEIARLLPRTRGLVREAGHLVAAATHSSEAATGSLTLAASALRGPTKLIARNKAEGSGAQIRIERIGELATEVASIRRSLESAVAELQEVDASSLPRRARKAIVEGVRKARRTQTTLADAAAGFDILPGVLGADEPRLYLLGMQNSAEQRGTGGAMLQFALLAINDGRPELVEDASTVYDVDKNRTPLSIPLPEDAWYVAGIEDARRFGNANWSPDWPLSAELTVRYAQATPGIDFPEVDGVIGVDPVVMQELLPGTGPYRIKSGNRVSTNKVVHLVLYKAYASFPIAAVRRVVLNQIVDGFYEGMLDPLHPTELTRGMGAALAGKHMQIWLTDPAEQAFVERMNWDGAIESDEPGDYLYVVQQNVGGNKADYFADITTSMEVDLSGDEALVGTTVEIYNGVFLPQPRWSMGVTKGIHRPMVNVYVPFEAELVDWAVDGKRLDSPAPSVWASGRPAEHTERGRRVWSGTLEIPPGERGSLRFEYRVPEAVVSEDGRSVYRLVLQRQPKVRPEDVEVLLQLPEGASDVAAPGWSRRGDTLLWKGALRRDMVLEVSWQE